MQIAFLEESLQYDGSQLSSHFAYKRLGLLGDSCVAFIGPCEVALAAMVDLEDVRRVAPIYSPKMLHFLLESFHLDLNAGVLLQRLCVAIVQEELRVRGISEVQRKGDDLYVGEKKLSVSIATRSLVSTLIHLGLNILSEGTPVPTMGLEEKGIDAREFGRACLKKFQGEFEDVLKATYKVRGVS
jgi:uncharacterized protein